MKKNFVLLYTKKNFLFFNKFDLTLSHLQKRFNVIHSRMSMGVTSAQVHALFRKFIIVPIISCDCAMSFLAVFAFPLIELDPNVAQIPRILQ